MAKTLPQAPTLTLDELWRLEGRSELLGPVGWVVIGPSDEIYVGHHLDGRIMAFDSTGERRGILGGPGREPGRFQNLMRAGTVGDSLWVYDGALRRVTVFGPDLRLARSFEWPTPYDAEKLAATRDASMPYLLGITPHGSIVASVYRERLTPAEADSLNLPKEEPLFVPMGRALMAHHDVPPDVVYGDGFAIGNTRLFPIDPLFAAATDGTAFVYLEIFAEGPQAGTFRVMRLNEAAETVFVREHPFYPVEIPREVRERAVEESVRRLRASGRGTRRAIETFRKAVHVPPVYPPVLSVLVGRDGSTWIRMRPLVEDNSEYYVLDAAGELVGQVSIPSSEEIVAAELTRVWSLVTDSRGVASLAVHSVEHPE